MDAGAGSTAVSAGVHLLMALLLRRCLCCRAMDCKVAELRAGTDLTRIWIHADLDAFFASVEELDDPSLVRETFHPPLPEDQSQGNGGAWSLLCLTGRPCSSAARRPHPRRACP